MCDPLTITTALTIGSQAIGAVGQFQQAQGQRETLEATARQQASEQSDATEVEIGERVREGRRERARLRVAGGEAGLAISGSFESQLVDSFSQQGRDIALTEFQADQQAASLQTRVNNESASISGDRPLDVIGAGLQIASASAPAFSKSNKTASNLTIPGG